MTSEQDPAPSAESDVVSLILREEAFLYRIARKLTRCDDDAKDLVQDTLLRAFKARERFIKGSSVRAWTSTILRRVFLGAVRKRKGYNTQLASEADVSVDREAASEPEGATDEVLNIDVFTECFDERALHALERLDPNQRVTFMFAVMYGLRHQEIAELLDIPVGTVMSRIHRARKRLRAELLGHADYVAIDRVLGRKKR